MKYSKFPKNPCKICLQQVTNRNGLQCQGCCGTWVHYKCLNYTPGKIHDIKAGVIKVICPCPNCNTRETKEFLNNPPFSCTNSLCPANLPPACESTDCTIRLDKPISCYPPCVCALNTSDTSCKSSQSPPNAGCECPSCPKCDKPPVVYDCLPEPKQCVAESTQACPPRSSNASLNKITKKDECCSCSSSLAPSRSQSLSSLQKKCDTSGKKENMRPASSESQISCTEKGGDHNELYSVIQNLCDTVGNLSTQLKYLMCKLEKSNH